MHYILDPEAIDLYSHEKLPIVQDGSGFYGLGDAVFSVLKLSRNKCVHMVAVELYTKESSLNCSLRINNHNQTY